ncbi:MAG: hypothetical protein HKN87_04535 [Saprospiraceae bacterium]|nr:hypothetical protein [Saprospiraceae bacterium]
MSKIIHLLSSPRTISTAIMYAFAQHRSVQVLDEPFYGIYLQNHGHNHPGRNEIRRRMPTTIVEVQERIINLAADGHVFIKNMASHCSALGLSFPADYQHIFLIRNPAQIILSFDKVVDNPTHEDIGIKAQYKLFTQYHSAKNLPLVLESTRVAAAPKEQLEKLCNKLSIDFEETMLSWPKGPKAYDGIWSKYWYKAVHSTTRFLSRPEVDITLPKNLRKIHEEAQFYYQQLLAHTL